MNIQNVLNSIKLSSKTPQSVDVQSLISAIETGDYNSVQQFITSNPQKHFLRPSVLRCLFNHFTPELGQLFLSEPFFQMVVNTVENEVDVPEIFWKWAVQQNNHVLDNWVQTVWTSDHPIDSFVRKNARVYLAARLDHSPDKISDFIDRIQQFVQRSCVLQWNQNDRNIIRTRTSAQWQQRFADSLSINSMIRFEKDPQLTYIQRSLSQLPELEQAVDEYYRIVQQKYKAAVAHFSSPLGLRKSPGLSALSKTLQKEFLHDLSFDYNNDDSPILVSKYKHLLGYSDEELFLLRFGEMSGEILSTIDKKTSSAYNMYRNFGHKTYLSPLHALLINSPQIVATMDKTMGPAIAQCFNDGAVLHSVFENIDTKIFNKILKKFPEVAQWRDAKGNSLGHWFAIYRLIEDECLDVLVKHPILLQKNSLGYGVKDIMRWDIDRGASDNEDCIAALEKIELISVLKADGCEGKILTKRKM